MVERKIAFGKTFEWAFEFGKSKPSKSLLFQHYTVSFVWDDVVGNHMDHVSDLTRMNDLSDSLPDW